MSEKRKRFNKIATIILFGFLVISFGLWGIGDVFRGGGQSTVVARVGGLEIQAQSFADVLTRQIRRLQQSFGRALTRDEIEQLGIPADALRQLVQSGLMMTWAEDKGVVVTQDQIVAAIRAYPDFQINGAFSEERFRQSLRNIGFSEAQFVEALRIDLMRVYLTDPAEESTQLPAIAVDTLYNYLGEQRVADYATIAAANMEVTTEPDEAALKQVYDDNPDAFRAPEYRKVTLLHLTAASFLDEVDITTEQARTWFDNNPGEYQQAERRALRQIILEDEEAARAALDALQGGATLEAVASDAGASVASVASQTEEELSRVLPELAAAAFALGEDQRYGLVQTLLGWHVFEVSEVTPARDVAFEEVEEQIKSQLTEAAAEEALDSIADQVDADLGSGATLDEVTERLNLRLRTIDAIDRNGRDPDGNYVEDLPSPPQVLPLLFEQEVGYESLMSQAADGSWFAFRIDEVTPPAVRPFDTVQSQATELWRALERQRLAEAKAADIAEQINSGGGDLSSIAWSEGLELAQSAPLERTASGQAVPAPKLPELLFGATEGQAVSTATADGALVAVLTEIRPADPGSERRQQIEQALDTSLQRDMIAALLRSLERQYPVEVNQTLIDEILSRY